jgi:hypothetical protein
MIPAMECSTCSRVVSGLLVLHE